MANNYLSSTMQSTECLALPESESEMDSTTTSLSGSASSGPFDEDLQKCYVTKGAGFLNCIIDIVGEVEGEEPCVVADIIMRNSKYQCCITLEEYRVINELVTHLKSVTGRNIMCTFNLHDIKCYIQRKHQQYVESGITVQFTVAPYLGLQKAGNIIINSGVQVDENGVGKCKTLIPQEMKRYASVITCGQLQLSPNPLGEWIDTMQEVFKHNFMSALATVAGYSFLITYPLIMEVTRGVPALHLYSLESATGKSTALRLATDVHGQPDSVKSEVTPAALKRHAHYSGFPTVLDDISIDKDISRRIIDHYTATGVRDGKKNYKIRGGLLISSNQALPNEERVTSKVLTIEFSPPAIAPVTDKEFLNYQRLIDLTERSRPHFLSAIHRIITSFMSISNDIKQKQMEVVRDAVGESCHPRVVCGYSNLLYFMTEILKLTGKTIPDRELLAFAADSSSLCLNPELDVVKALLEAVDKTDLDKRRFMVSGDKGAYLYPAGMPADIKRLFEVAKKSVGMKRSCQRFLEGSEEMSKKTCYLLSGYHIGKVKEKQGTSDQAKNHEVLQVLTMETIETMECAKIEIAEVFTIGALLEKAQEVVVELKVASKRKNVGQVVGFTNKIELHFIIIV